MRARPKSRGGDIFLGGTFSLFGFFSHSHLLRRVTKQDNRDEKERKKENSLLHCTKQKSFFSFPSFFFFFLQRNLQLYMILHFSYPFILMCANLHDPRLFVSSSSLISLFIQPPPSTLSLSFLSPRATFKH